MPMRRSKNTSGQDHITVTEKGLLACRRHFTRRQEEIKENDILCTKSLVVGLGKTVDRVDGT